MQNSSRDKARTLHTHNFMPAPFWEPMNKIPQFTQIQVPNKLVHTLTLPTALLLICKRTTSTILMHNAAQYHLKVESNHLFIR